MYCINFQRATYQYNQGMFMCTMIYFNQALKQGMVYSGIFKPGTHTNQAHMQTRHTNWAHKPGTQTGHTNEAHKPGTQTRHTAFHKNILILHIAFQYFSIPGPYFHYDQKNNYTVKYIETQIPAHASRLASSPGYPFPLSLIHNLYT